MTMYNLIIIGGGAAGVFGAISARQANRGASVLLLERSGKLLSKVRISGGGRCNVTHACFEPNRLVLNYPRGSKALLGPFHRFQPKDTVAWFEERGVRLKTEEDGRMFPVTDSSETIIACLLQEAKKLGVEIRTLQRIEKVEKKEGFFEVHFETGESCTSANLLLASGSSPLGYEIAKSFGHTIVEPVPSLFTFNVPGSPLLDLSGIAVAKAAIKLTGTKLVQTGPLLLTHWGFSGPAALKLSSWAARELHALQYQAKISIDWLPDHSLEDLKDTLIRLKAGSPSKSLLGDNPFQLPKNLWKRFLELLKMEGKRYAELSHAEIYRLTDKLHADPYQVSGKTTNKEEFVTCGGVSLNEVDFKTMQSKLVPGLFFAGEILDIDGITGGFNFQNGWTTSWIAGHSIFLFH